MFDTTPITLLLLLASSIVLSQIIIYQHVAPCTATAADVVVMETVTDDAGVKMQRQVNAVVLCMDGTLDAES